jgi:hypothetical protein
MLIGSTSDGLGSGLIPIDFARMPRGNCYVQILAGSPGTADVPGGGTEQSALRRDRMLKSVRLQELFWFPRDLWQELSPKSQRCAGTF